MKIEQIKWTSTNGWDSSKPGMLGKTAQLLIVFGSTSLLKNRIQLDELHNMYPNAIFWGCSTAGEICDKFVTDESLSVTAVEFEKTTIKVVDTKINAMTESYRVGEYLSANLPKEGLRHVLVLSDGLQINGSELVSGLVKNLPKEVKITGGLSADGGRFQETYVFRNGIPERDVAVVLGLYGENLTIGYGSLGGWDPFGPERLITKSRGNILYELDNKSALDLYKQYLGNHAVGLPATGLLFPLCVRTNEHETGVVRTILAIDEELQTMTFAGDVHEGEYARLMKANFDRLIDGARGAAQICCDALGEHKSELAILISCVGRKMVLKQRVEEEVEIVKEVLGEHVVQTGFYSYGEISPFTYNEKCELHNQTMTITTISEK